MKKNITVVLLLVLAAGCGSQPLEGGAPPMDPSRKVDEQDCSRQISLGSGNLLCRELTAAQRRAQIAEEERQARARKEAAERAERERLERERAEQLAREEAARKARAAEEERLAAERRRLEAEAAAAAAAAAAAERERREKAEAEARARQRAEQEKREAAERECRRLEQERSDGRALLADFVAKYGKAEEFKGIAGQISEFLGKASKPKPCPPA
jgi:hypothetical protein